MELMNEFEVDVPVDEAWAVLTDLRRLTPCVPGARLDDAGGDDELRGILHVRVGPIDAQYEARSAFVELLEDKRQIVMSINGHDIHGQGDATASITIDLGPRGKHTQVAVLADLSVSGKVAQFGRGVLADVSGDLLRQFSENLQAEVTGVPARPRPAHEAVDDEVATDEAGGREQGSPVATAAARRGATEPGVRALSTTAAGSLGDKGSTAPTATEAGGLSVLTRVAAAAGAVLAVAAFGYLLRSRRRRPR